MAHPDDAKGTKHKLICHGVRKLCEGKGWDIKKVCLWVDFCGTPSPPPQGLLCVSSCCGVAVTFLGRVCLSFAACASQLCCAACLAHSWSMMDSAGLQCTCPATLLKNVAEVAFGLAEADRGGLCAQAWSRMIRRSSGQGSPLSAATSRSATPSSSLRHKSL